MDYLFLYMFVLYISGNTDNSIYYCYTEFLKKKKLNTNKIKINTISMTLGHVAIFYRNYLTRKYRPYI